MQAAEQGWLASAHDVAEGGLAVALAESCIANPDGAIGARISLDSLDAVGTPTRADAVLFGEGPSCVVVSVEPADWPRMEKLLDASGLPFFQLGEVGGEYLNVAGYLKHPVGTLREHWRTALASALTASRESA